MSTCFVSCLGTLVFSCVCWAQFNQSPLHSAAFGGHLPCVHLLVENGATVDAESKVKQGMPYVCQLMLAGCRSIRHPTSCDGWVFLLPKKLFITACPTIHYLTLILACPLALSLAWARLISSSSSYLCYFVVCVCVCVCARAVALHPSPHGCW